MLPRRLFARALKDDIIYGPHACDPAYRKPICTPATKPEDEDLESSEEEDSDTTITTKPE